MLLTFDKSVSFIWYLSLYSMIYEAKFLNSRADTGFRKGVCVGVRGGGGNY